MIHVTKTMALDALKAAVDEAGEDAVRDCKYVVNSEAYCIAAAALFRLGVPLDVISRMEKTTFAYGCSRMSDVVTLTSGAVAVIDAAQSVQDLRRVDDRTWGAAYRAAAECAANLEGE